jgi:short-subunit dehydrogenase
MRLDGAVALVTGAGSGIGRALAIELAARGARLILVGRREEAIKETASLLGEKRDAIQIAADICRPEDVARLVRVVNNATQHLSLLVNNAGIVVADAFDGIQDEDLERMVATNLIAPMTLAREFLPLLKVADQARIVNIGSMFGDIAFPCFAAYSATKFGLRGWSEALRRELASQKIGVTYCAPRGTRTPAVEGFDRFVKAFQMKLDPPGKVAAAITAGIEKDARDIYPMGPERLFLLVQRLFPRVIDASLSKFLSESFS